MKINVIQTCGRQYFTPEDIAKMLRVQEVIVWRAIEEMQLPMLILEDESRVLALGDVARLSDYLLALFKGGKHAE